MGQIKDLCEKHNIKDYIINDDNTISVMGDVIITSDIDCIESEEIKYTKLPFKFKEIDGNFICSGLGLETLEGCPYYVGGDFICSKNNISTLEFGPQYVGGDCDYSNNKINSFKYAPTILFGGIDISNNLLETLEYCPSIYSFLDISFNNIKTFKYISLTINDIVYDNTLIPKEFTILDKFLLNDILKYQDVYKIWLDDDSLNLKNYYKLLYEYFHS